MIHPVFCAFKSRNIWVNNYSSQNTSAEKEGGKQISKGRAQKHQPYAYPQVSEMYDRMLHDSKSVCRCVSSTDKNETSHYRRIIL